MTFFRVSIFKSSLSSSLSTFRHIFWRHNHFMLLYQCTSSQSLLLFKDSKIGIYQKMWRFMEVSVFRFLFALSSPIVNSHKQQSLNVFLHNILFSVFSIPQSKKPSVFVATYEDGIKRVLEGNYAFLMESTMLDYAVQRDCNLTQIGGNSLINFFT